MKRDDMRHDRPRVFAIGLNKTGTSSFHQAVTRLGFESLHWGGPPVRLAVEAALASDRPLLSDLDPRYDAFSDILALSTNFALLDEQYPGSRFVLTVRPVEAWIESRRRHVQSNIRRHDAGDYHGTFLVVDEAGWRAEWQQHTSAVRRYFTSRSDFLELDLATSAGWGPLCSLLDVAPPDEPYPWINRDRTAGSRP